MFRFLRHFRKKLISDSNITKYLFYALGEILLVMIGILLALQVNNWNQERLNRMESKAYHQRLMDDLDIITNYAQNQSEFASKVGDYIDKAVVELERGTASDSTKEILDFALGNYFRLSRVSPQLTSYDEMKSSGKIGLIYNTELREKISEFLNFYELVTTVSEDLNKKVNISQVFDPFIKFNQESNFHNTVLEYSFEEIATTPLIIHTLSRFAFHWKTKSDFSKRLQVAGDNLKTEIEKELN